ncbi:helix-turn-helix domain-containing protein [Amycolatopsis sp. FU40]|uniref:helix-turn-helix domain-containing protein n=1 Tax=Amycolatopsis sp. FU40 TaxID=2914159 RepID=UPI001F334E04|nr:helix-turn-helix transcriptional regulator [Amycolatopsis sp. FU40]UKD55131.1 helix-turn-helix domain-containing protein [Amycolatopsis sp. FU40]
MKRVALGRAVGARLRDLREQRGVSLSEVGRRMNVDPSRVYTIERSGKDPQISTVVRYCDAIGARVYIGFPTKEAP